MYKRKIPTILGLLLVFGAVFIFSIAFDRITPLLSRASPSATPKHVTFSNVSDTAFTLSWITDAPATGAVLIDGSGFGTAYDQRDEVSAASTTKPTLGSYTIHSVMIRNARPRTTYHIRILSDGALFQDGIRPYSVTTGLSLSDIGTTLEPAYGSVTLPNGQPATDAIVYLTPETGQTLSAFVTTTGSWVIPLHLARTADLASYLAVSERLKEAITIQSAEGTATAITDTLNDNPVPQMTIGKTYDFRHIQADASPKPIAQAQPTVLGDTAPVSNQEVAITQPANGASLPTNLPIFQGTGVIGNQVYILIGITNPQTGTTTVGSDGIWRFTPVHALADGKQSITITTKDKNGKTAALTNLFTVFKSGTQVLGDATPSATIEPTSIETPTPTATRSGEPVPTTGGGMPTILLLLFGTMFFIGGATVLFL